MAAASFALACGSAAHAGTFTVLNATGSSDFSASQGFGEGSSGFDTQHNTGLGTFNFGNATGGGFTELFKAPSVHASFGASNSGGASATMTYEFAFTATHPGEVFSLIHNAIMGPPIDCQPGSTAQICTNPPPAPIEYYIADATSISGSYALGADGYARATVSADAWAAPGSGFTMDCGFGSFSGCGKDDSRIGTFNIAGGLMANADSIDANSFFGFITLSAHGAVFEGGDFDAFIDPMISLNLPGLDPKDFTLSISPNLTSGAGGVPEPAAWALMLLGFGGIGASLRRRRLVAA